VRNHTIAGWRELLEGAGFAPASSRT
jgi:hypothetical protein